MGRKCVRNADAFLAVYEKLVQEVVCPYLKAKLGGSTRISFYYQYPPTLRIQPGPSQSARRVHEDAQYGHQEGELNFWMPITYFSKTQTTLWVESAAGAADFHPFMLEYGEIGMFHGTLCRHCVPPNVATS